MTKEKKKPKKPKNEDDQGSIWAALKQKGRV